MSISLTETDIQRVVEKFYTQVRKDSLLGPVFATKIADTDEAWKEHQAHIADFWSSIFHKTGRFTGNPMKKHAGLADITPEHFTHWLDLFTKTAQATLSEEKADIMTSMAQRIARSLQMGLAFHHDGAGKTDHPFKDFSIHASRSHTEGMTS